MIKIYSIFNNKVFYIIILIACYFSPNLVLASETETEENSVNELCKIVTKTEPNKIVTQETISQTELTIPSLWWRRKLLDPDKEIILDWKAHTEDRIIDLIVDREQWSVLDYIQRYSIVNEFGSLAREYQYNVRVISERQVCLVTYNCNFELNPDRCQIEFEFFGRRSLGR